MKWSSLQKSVSQFKPKMLYEIDPLLSYSQHFFFFVTYEWVKYARVFAPGKLFQPIVM